jgi:hypothetical protein
MIQPSVEDLCLSLLFGSWDSRESRASIEKTNWNVIRHALKACTCKLRLSVPAEPWPLLRFQDLAEGLTELEALPNFELAIASGLEYCGDCKPVRPSGPG